MEELEKGKGMRIHRVNEGKWVAGVATGLAKSLGIDVTIVRIIFAALTVFGASGILIYAILWALMPREEGGSVAEDGVDHARAWYDERKRR